MSDILTIYATFEGLSVTADGKTPGVYAMDTLKNWAESADLPARLLSVGAVGPGVEGEFIALGTAAATVWEIHDLLLWQVAGLGRGLQDYNEALLEYAGAYVEALRAVRGPASSGADQAYITGWEVRPGTYQFPAGAGKNFYGVECVVRVREVLGG